MLQPFPLVSTGMTKIFFKLKTLQILLWNEILMEIWKKQKTWTKMDHHNLIEILLLEVLSLCLSFQIKDKNIQIVARERAIGRQR